MEQLVILDEIITAHGKKIAHLTINRPGRLNVLSLAAIKDLRSNLAAIAKNDNFAAVILDGAGEKAFCAGGDVTEIVSFVQSAQGGELNPASEYFINEYTVDYTIHTYPKPIIIWGDGIVMGGGMGLMQGGSHRIVTEKTMLAMPEITIGLFPDVGGTWFLNKMPDKSGMFAGLTGLRMNAADAILCNLADHALLSSAKADLLKSLESLELSDNAKENNDIITDLLENMSGQHPKLQVSEIEAHFELIEQIIDMENHVDSYHKIIEQQAHSEWMQNAVTPMVKGSPTSFAVIFEQLDPKHNLSLKEVFMKELDMAINMTAHSDFAEGVRALLVDKDNNPKWSPSDLSEVEQAVVNGIFASPWSDDKHPLMDL
ncbi:MAG: enoyl-CoA hydratase/isomerase family protein [Gammaproteobacteria bacterium]|nr:MAG: enoyl-CoA hydratase/isomerase family protein [Gammaproteobacteria bacterium]